MKKLLGIIAIMAMVTMAFAGCEGPEDPPDIDEDSPDIDIDLRNEINAYIVQVTADLGDLNGVVIDLNLPTSYNGITVIWSSSNSQVLSTTGQINLPETESVTVTLTGTFSKGNATLTRVFSVTVPAEATLTETQQDMRAFALDIRDFQIDTFMDYFHYDIILPHTTEGGSSVTWASNSITYPILPDRVPDNGRSRVKVTDNTNFRDTINLTATITRGDYTRKKEFPVQVVDQVYTGYLYCTFLGSNPNTEQLFFALSRDLTVPHDDPRDGWKVLNNGKPVARSISSTGGIRDPFIQRHPDGSFVLSATDMHATSPGSQNRGLVLAKSPDLINWTFTDVNVRQKFPANFGNATSAWAPCVIWDRKKGQFMVTWSTAGHSGYMPFTTNLMFYAYINNDFTDFATAPVRVFRHWDETATSTRGCIDISITYFNGDYYASWKNEGSGEISQRVGLARSSTINGGAGAMDWSVIHQSIDNETSPVGSTTKLQTEGPEWARKIGTEEMVLFWDRHAGTQLDGLSRETSRMRTGYMSSSDFVTWNKTVFLPAGSGSNQNYTMKADFSPNHGSIIPLTEAEYQRLLTYTAWDSQAQQNPTVTADAPLRLHYTFGASDTAGTAGNGSDSVIVNAANPGTHNGIVRHYFNGGAGRAIVNYNGTGIRAFYTGTSTGTLNDAMTSGNTPAFIDMGQNASSIITDQNDFTVATYIRTNSDLLTLVGWSNNMNSHNNLWSFASTMQASATAGAYIQYRGTAQGYRITTEGNNNVSGITWGETIPTGVWQHIMYRQAGELGTIYINGVPTVTASTRVRTTHMPEGTPLIYNWIGRGAFHQSNGMPNSYFADFRIYGGAISEAQIAAMNINATLAILNTP